MKILLLSISIIFFSSFVASQQNSSESTVGESEECQERNFFFDRNHDGAVDIKYLRSPCFSHSDFAWVDSDYDGRFDIRVFYGLGPEYSKIDVQVPKNVKLNSEQEYTKIYGIIFKEKNKYIGI